MVTRTNSSLIHSSNDFSKRLAIIIIQIAVCENSCLTCNSSDLYQDISTDPLATCTVLVL